MPCWPRHRAAGRPDRLQSLVYDRRVQPARQSQPRTQGGLRGQLRPPPVLSVPRGAAAAQRASSAGAAGAVQRRQPVRAVASPALARGLLNLSVFREELRAKNLHRYRGGEAAAPGRSRAAARPGSGADVPHIRRHVQRSLRSQDGIAAGRLSAAPWSRVYGPTNSISPTRSWSAASC